MKTIENFTNPFIQENDELYNLVTKVVVPAKVKNGLMWQNDIGHKLTLWQFCQRSNSVWEDGYLVANEEEEASDMKDLRKVDQAFYRRPDSKFTRSPKPVCLNVGDMLETSWDWSQRSCRNIRVYSGSKITVCWGRRNVPLLYGECIDAYPREVTEQLERKKQHLPRCCRRIRAKECGFLSSMLWLKCNIWTSRSG